MVVVLHTVILPLFDAQKYSGIIRARAEVHMLVAI